MHIKHNKAAYQIQYNTEKLRMYTLLLLIFCAVGFFFVSIDRNLLFNIFVVHIKYDITWCNTTIWLIANSQIIPFRSLQISLSQSQTIIKQILHSSIKYSTLPFWSNAAQRFLLVRRAVNEERTNHDVQGFILITSSSQQKQGNSNWRTSSSFDGKETRSDWTTSFFFYWFEVNPVIEPHC